MLKTVGQVKSSMKKASVPGVPHKDVSDYKQRDRKVPGTPRRYPDTPIIRKGVTTGPTNEDGAAAAPAMSAGTGGFSNAADAKGPVAGYDKVMGFKMFRRKKPK